MKNCDYDHIRKETIKRLIINERLQPFDWNSTFENLKGQRYPFERTLNDYKKLMPHLEAELNHLNSKSKVLDIGCGEGIAINDLKKEYHAEVIGTGIKWYPEIKSPFVSSIAAHLPFPNQTFDLIISAHSLSWEPDQLSAVNESIRVLKNFGTAILYFCTFSSSASLWFEESFWFDIGIEEKTFCQNEFCENDIYKFDPIIYFSRKGMRWKNWIHEFYIVIKKQLSVP